MHVLVEELSHLSWLQVLHDLAGVSLVKQGHSVLSEVVVADDSLNGTVEEDSHGVFDTVHDSTSVHVDFLIHLVDSCLFLNELDVRQAALAQVDGLTETLFTAIADVHDVEDDLLESLIEDWRLSHLNLEVCATSDDDAFHVWSVIGQEERDSGFAHLSDVVLSLFHSDTSKTLRRLTSSAVFLRQVHSELLENFSSISLDSTIQCTGTIDDDESELLLGCEQFSESLCLEGGCTLVQTGVDCFDWLEVQNELLLCFAVFSEHFTLVDQQSVVRNLVVELQLLSDGVDSLDNRLSVDSVLDLLGLSRFFLEHLLDVGDLLSSRNDDSDHGSSTSLDFLQLLDESLELELLNEIFLRLHLTDNDSY